MRERVQLQRAGTLSYMLIRKLILPAGDSRGATEMLESLNITVSGHAPVHGEEFYRAPECPNRRIFARRPD